MSGPLRWIALLGCCAASACLVEVSYEGTEFLCAGDCPHDLECAEGQCVPPIPAPIVHWPFDSTEDASTPDVSGNGRDGSVLGATIDTGMVGSALRFDGTGGSVSDPNGPNYLNGLTALTVTVWVKSDATNTDAGILNGIFAEDGRTFDGAGLSLRYDEFGVSGDGADGLKFGVADDAGERQQGESMSNRQTTDWQFLAITWSAADDVRLFIDGQYAMPDHLEPERIGAIGSVETLVVGRGAKDVTTSWSGLIDDVRIYDRVLSDIDIRRAGGITPP